MSWSSAFRRSGPAKAGTPTVNEPGRNALASASGSYIAKRIMEPQTRTPVKESLFAYPFWLMVGVPAVVCLITTLAAWYPAYRAARVDPVTSPRHE